MGAKILFKGAKMILNLIGKIKEVRQVNRKNKDGVNVAFVDVMVHFADKDKDGYLVESIEHVNYPIEFLMDLVQAKGKYISIPYVVLNTPKGTYVFPDENMKYKIFEKNPFEIAVKK